MCALRDVCASVREHFGCSQNVCVCAPYRINLMPNAQLHTLAAVQFAISTVYNRLASSKLFDLIEFSQNICSMRTSSCAVIAPRSDPTTTAHPIRGRHRSAQTSVTLTMKTFTYDAHMHKPISQSGEIEWDCRSCDAERESVTWDVSPAVCRIFFRRLFCAVKVNYTESVL